MKRTEFNEDTKDITGVDAELAKKKREILIEQMCSGCFFGIVDDDTAKAAGVDI